MTHRLVRAGGQHRRVPDRVPRPHARASRSCRSGIVSEAFGLVAPALARRPPRPPPPAPPGRPASAPDDRPVGSWRRGRAHDPPRRHGRVLRRPSSCAAGPSCAASRSWSAAPGRRGVVAAASYEARRYGVHSAMPSAVGPPAVPARGVPARRPRRLRGGQRARCTTIFAARHPARRAARARRGVPRRHRCPRAARRRRDDRPPASATAIDDELGLTCSVGVAPNKFLAKLASVDGQAAGRRRTGVRPGPGVVEVRPGRRARVPPPAAGRAAVGRRPGDAASGCSGSGVAHRRRPRRARRRRRSSARSAGPTAGTSLDLADGRDDRPVEPDREVKSIGHEETFAHDLHDSTTSARELVRLADAVAAGCGAHGIGGAHAHAQGPLRRVRARSPGRPRSPARSTPADAIVGALRPLLDAVDLAAGRAPARRVGVASSPRRPSSCSFDDLASTDAGRRAPLERRQPGDRRRPRALRRRRDRPGEQRRVGPDGRRVRVRRGPAVGPDHGPTRAATLGVRALRNGPRTWDDERQCRSPSTNSASSARSSSSSSRTRRSRTRGYRVAAAPAGRC